MAKSRADLRTILEMPLSASEFQIWKSPIYLTTQLAPHSLRAHAGLNRDGASGLLVLELITAGNVIQQQGSYDYDEVRAFLGIEEEDSAMLWTRDLEHERLMGEVVERGKLVIPGPGYNGGRLH